MAATPEPLTPFVKLRLGLTPSWRARKKAPAATIRRRAERCVRVRSDGLRSWDGWVVRGCHGFPSGMSSVRDAALRWRSPTRRGGGCGQVAGHGRLALRCGAPEAVELALGVDDLDGEREDSDQIEDEAEPDVDRFARGAVDLLRRLDALERAVHGDERRHQDQPAESDRHQRREWASAEPFFLTGCAAEVTEFAIDLVVPDQVVDPERHEDQQERCDRAPNLCGRGGSLNAE